MSRFVASVLLFAPFVVFACGLSALSLAPVTVRPPSLAAALTQDGGVVCPAPIPFHAYVTANGSDDYGNGSITCPYASPQYAVSQVMAVPTSQAEYEQPRVVEVLGPGTFPYEVDVPTLANAAFRLQHGVKLTGKLVFHPDTTEQFSSATAPGLFVLGDGVTSVSVGDGADAVVIAATTHPSSFPGLTLNGLTLNGTVSTESATVTPFLSAADFSSTSTGTYSVNAANLTISNAHNGKFGKGVVALKVSILAKVDFFQGPVTIGAGGSAGNLTTTGWRDCGFSSNAANKTITEGGPLRIDGVTNYNLKTAGWSVTPSSVVVQLQDDLTPIVPN